MGRKDLNPADAYRKEQRKKEIKKSKQKQAAVKQVTDMLNNPQQIEEEVYIITCWCLACIAIFHVSNLILLTVSFPSDKKGATGIR